MFGSLPAAVSVLLCVAVSPLPNVREAAAVKIVTLVGQTVILPCVVELPNDKNLLDLEWKRGKDWAFVYRNGCESPSDKNDSFLYRTHLTMKEPKDGNMSLRLSEVRLSDAGNYTGSRTEGCTPNNCPVDCTVELIVGAASEPKLALVQGDGVTLQCEASCWSSKPDVTFFDAEGNVIRADEPKYDENPQSGCYSVTRRATVQAGNNFTCRVNESGINQTRSTEIYIPDYCMKSWNIPLVVGISIAIAIAVVAIAIPIETFKLRTEWRRLFCPQSSVQNLPSSKDPSQNPEHQDPLIQNESNEQQETKLRQEEHNGHESPRGPHQSPNCGVHSKNRGTGQEGVPVSPPVDQQS